MLFDTPIYFCFLALTVLVYWRLSHHWQNRFLLVLSYFFYGWWDWRFLSLIFISTVVDYSCANWIASTDNIAKRRLSLAFSVSVNLLFLGFFKYFNFFVDTLHAVLGSVGINVQVTTLRIILPPAISFYTFQELAYIVDVYRGKLPACRSLVDYALFVTLFPHLIAGPIQKPSHLLPQVQSLRQFNARFFADGMLLIVTGLFRKCVIADNCALIANAAFNGQLGPPSTMIVLLGTFAFAWQIYGDFSGYSDIARGSAQLIGFHFMVNFKQPYLATNLQDFWRRWHISLSSWLRDYLYIGLGGNRHGKLKTYRNLACTMLLGGLWHGANWTFVIWGALHGAGLAIGRFVKDFISKDNSRPKIDADITSLVSFSGWVKRIMLFHFVCFAWIFFRAESFPDALRFLSGITSFSWKPEFLIAAKFLVLFTVPLFLLDLLLEKTGDEYPCQSHFVFYRIAVASALIFFTAFLSANQANAFIYFQF